MFDNLWSRHHSLSLIGTCTMYDVVIFPYDTNNEFMANGENYKYQHTKCFIELRFSMFNFSPRNDLTIGMPMAFCLIPFNSNCTIFYILSVISARRLGASLISLLTKLCYAFHVVIQIIIIARCYISRILFFNFFVFVLNKNNNFVHVERNVHRL